MTAVGFVCFIIALMLDVATQGYGVHKSVRRVSAPIGLLGLALLLIGFSQFLWRTMP